MKNFVAMGNVLPFVAAATIVAGPGLLLGAIFGVVANDVATGEDGQLNLGGVYELPKAASQAWTVGAAVYWDDTAKVCTTTSAGNTLIGVAYAAVGSGAGEILGLVRLNGTV